MLNPTAGLMLRQPRPCLCSPIAGTDTSLPLKQAAGESRNKGRRYKQRISARSNTHDRFLYYLIICIYALLVFLQTVFLIICLTDSMIVLFPCYQYLLLPLNLFICHCGFLLL